MKTKAKKSKKSASAMIDAAKKEVEKAKAKSSKLVKPRDTKPPKPTRYKATLEEAKDRTADVKALFVKMGEEWWELGAKVKSCIDDYVPEALGKKATEWMKELFGDSWLKVYRANRAIAAVGGVPKEKYQKISEGNAYQLARLPEKIRKSEEWIDKAIKMGNEQFKEVVERQREKKGVKRDPMIKVAEVLGFTTIPKTLADLLKQVMKQAGQAENVDMDEKSGRITAFEAIVSNYLVATPTEEEMAAAEGAAAN